MAFIRRAVSVFTAIISIISSFFGFGGTTDKKVDSFRVTTYIIGDYVQSADSLRNEDFDIVTDVILFDCASFDNEGNVNLREEVLENALSNIRSATGDRDIDITLNLIGPSGKTDSEIWRVQMEAQSDEHNKAFTSGVLEDNIVAVLDKYGFDGVHFDYEYPMTLKAWYYYNKFLVSLDGKLGDYTLGVAASEWNLKFSSQAIKAIDSFEIMLYDFLDNEGRHSTYEGMVDLAKNIGLYGIPIEKVNLGLPFYSRPTDMSAYWYDYSSFYTEIDENGWYHCDTTGKDFWFNRPDVIYDKTDYAITEGFGGVMIWHYSCDLPSGDADSLTGAIGRAVADNYGVN